MVHQFGELTMLNLSIHEHSMSPHLFSSSLISFLNQHEVAFTIQVLYMSGYIYPEVFHFILSYLHDILFLISVSMCLLLIYRNMVVFVYPSCVLQPFQTHLLVSLSRFLEILNLVMSSASRGSLISSF